MIANDYQFGGDVVAKFQHTLSIRGWFHHQQDWLVGVEVVGPGILAQLGNVGLVHDSVRRSDGRGCGFTLDCFRAESGRLPDDLEIRFLTHRGHSIQARIVDLAQERVNADGSLAVYKAFKEEVLMMDHPTVIDVGGRDRSRFDRNEHFPNCNYVVVDVLPGSNVDIVGDAHRLAEFVPAASADAVISAYTFEHLLMPWKAVVEINRVLKPGGLLCIMTHQTLGMHDLPWDFWRISGDAWQGLLNSYTGFEILIHVMSSPQFVIPFYYEHRSAFVERSAGFEFSTVIARKKSEPAVDWPVAVSDIIQTSYPDFDDGQRVKS